MTNLKLGVHTLGEVKEGGADEEISFRGKEKKLLTTPCFSQSGEKCNVYTAPPL